MSLVDWAKNHPAISSLTGVAAAGAITAGVVFSGVLAPEDPVAEPTAPVATASVKPTASTSEEPSATPSASADETVEPSATPSAAASSSAPAKATESSKPKPTSSAARTDEATIEELEGIGDGPQAPEPNENDAEVATAFGKAYANGGVGKDKWIKGMKPHTTPEFLAGFSGIDEQWIQVDELEDVNVTEDGDYQKIYDLRFKSGLVESVKLTLASDYQTWVVSDFGYSS